MMQRGCERSGAVAACPRCGYGNNDRADFCGNPDCGADLRVAASPAAPAPDPTSGHPEMPYVSASQPRTPPPGPTSAPQRPEGEQRRGVRITADPTELRVEPGGTATTTVTVRNRGTRVEQFRLAVNGPLASLVQVRPPVLSVFPDDEQTAEVVFAVPRAPWPPAGRAPFQVVARSDVHADVVDRVAGVLEVGPFTQLNANLDPEMTRGRRPGLHRVTLTNAGNAPLMVETELSDREGELTYDPPGFAVPVAPGATEVGEVRVGAKVRWFGRTQTFPFTATATTAGLPPIPLSGVRRQLPRFPWWIPVAAAVVITLLAIFVPPLFRSRVPDVGTLDRVAAVATLKDSGYEVTEIEKPDNGVAPGAVIGTDPVRDTVWEKGKRVALLLSTGPCSGPCPIKVPNVDGLTVEEATRDLTAAEFVVDRQDPVQNDRPAGQVISSNPAGGTMADRGTGVVLTVSTGPAVVPTSAAAATSAEQGPGGPGPGGPPGTGEELKVPDLGGRPIAQAEKELKGLDLVAKRTRVPSNEAELDVVLSSDPPAGSPVKPGATVTLMLAEPTGPVSLLTEAPKATWESTFGLEAFSLTFPGSDGAGEGFALVDPAATLEDGTTAKVLVTHPYWGPDGTITGTFTLARPVIAGDHLRAQVGFLTGSDDDVEFVVVANDQELARVPDSGADGLLQDLDADLTPAEGATTVEIVVLAGLRGDADTAVWKDARIEGEIG
jgi:beta-lactam-binding protein with PASTA domain